MKLAIQILNAEIAQRELAQKHIHLHYNEVRLEINSLKKAIIALTNMETIYSKKPFDGYTHRFIVQFEAGEPYHSNIDIYSNSDSYQKLDDFINEKKADMVQSFKIIHRATKEQDELASKFIEETIKNI